VREIRQVYRQLSKRYHPDTTTLPLDIAKAKFQQVNEAYATLSNPDQRYLYDLKIGYSRFNVIQSRFNEEFTQSNSSSAYLDPTDRPLSAGEIFALFILGLTFVACLVLAITIAILRGDTVWEMPSLSNNNPSLQQQSLVIEQHKKINL
jgi:DnaJ-class molecular chaperone